MCFYKYRSFKDRLPTGSGLSGEKTRAMISSFHEKFFHTTLSYLWKPVHLSEHPAQPKHKEKGQEPSTLLPFPFPLLSSPPPPAPSL